MNQKTAAQLLALNADFYQQTAQSFSDSRQYFWAGWTPILPSIKKLSSHELRVLDLGCGNARFAEFLAQKIPPSIVLKYFGWDNSLDLLHLAQEKISIDILQNQNLQLNAQTSFILDLVDLSATNFSARLKQEQPFHLICLFGVLHHVPSSQNRLKFLEVLSQQLLPGGLLVVSLWQFMKDPRLAARTLSCDQISSTTNIDPQQLESNDFILDWKRDSSVPTALRYCHHFADPEIAQLISDLEQSPASSLQLFQQFSADGPPQNPLNKYLIFQKTNSTHHNFKTKKSL